MVYTQVEVWRGIVITVKELEKIMCQLFDDFEIDDKVKDVHRTDSMIMNINDCLKDNYGAGKMRLRFTHQGDHGCRGSSGNPGWIIFGIMINAFPRKRFSMDDVAEEDKKFVEKFKNKVGKKAACCGKKMHKSEYTQEEDGYAHCGSYSVCDECIEKTVNGSYPVDSILDNCTECETYCFICNNDKCAVKHAFTPPFTIKDFVDKHLKDVCEEFDCCENEEDKVHKSNAGKNIIKKDDDDTEDIIDDSDNDESSSSTASGSTASGSSSTNRKSSYHLSKRIKNYYVLDDCLSCT